MTLKNFEAKTPTDDDSLCSVSSEMNGLIVHIFSYDGWYVNGNYCWHLLVSYPNSSDWILTETFPTCKQVLAKLRKMRLLCSK